MKPRLIAVIACAAAAALAASAWGRSRTDPDEVARFLGRAREGTRRYQNRQAAVDDGFTRVGAEFPAMGEHWVSYARILEDSLTAERPSVLIYVNTDSGPRLSGVAYTKLLAGDVRAPDFPRAGAWHEHNGAVDEESLPLHHTSHGLSATGDAGSPRLAILHAWIWNENPRGPFETDNWSLPLARLGISAAPDTPRDAIQALALADDRDGYLMLILRAAIELAPAEDSAAASVIAARRGRIAPITGRVRSSRVLDADHGRSLSGEWSGLWTDLATALPAHRAAIASLRARL